MSEKFPINNPSESETPLEQRMAEFRAEISELKRKEDDKEDSSSHFQFGEFNPADLTEKDMEIYEKFKKGTLSVEELDQYRDQVMKEEDVVAPKNEDLIPKFKTRGLLVGYIANKLGGILMRKEYEKRRAEKKERK